MDIVCQCFFLILNFFDRPLKSGKEKSARYLADLTYFLFFSFEIKRQASIPKEAITTIAPPGFRSK